MTLQNETRPAGGAAGLGNSSCLAADSSEIAPKLAIAQSQSRRVRLQFLAARLHILGAKPLFHFLDELERGADMRRHLEEYSRLPADFIKAYRGDRFAPALFPIEGGRRP